MPSLAGKVPVYQDPRIYNLALERHGQYMAWYRSTVCYCLTEFARPDPACNHCLGRGRVYDTVGSVLRIAEAVGNGSNWVVLAGYNGIESVQRVYSRGTGSWSVSSIVGNKIYLTAAVPKATIIFVDFVENLTFTYTGKAVAEEAGVISVPISVVDDRGAFYGQIITVNSIYNNTKALTPTVLDKWENRILVTDAHEATGDDIDVTVAWVKPVKFLVNQVWPTLIRNNPIIAEKFDAQVTFPGTFDMGAGDLLTPMKMKTRVSVHGIWKAGEVTHKLPFFHVASILKIETSAGEFTDFTLVRNNEIKWGVSHPADKFAVSLTYHPTFMVDDSVPSLRHAENKTFPKRMMLKRYDLFNRNVDRPNAKVTA